MYDQVSGLIFKIIGSFTNVHREDNILRTSYFEETNLFLNFFFFLKTPKKLVMI